MFELVQLIVIFRVTKLWVLSLKPAHSVQMIQYNIKVQYSMNFTFHLNHLLFLSHTEIKRQGNFQGIPFLILLARFPNHLNMFPFVHCSSLTKWLLQQVWPVSAPSTSPFTSLKLFPCGQGKTGAAQTVLSSILQSDNTSHTNKKLLLPTKSCVTSSWEKHPVKNHTSKNLQNFHRKKH